MTIPQFSSGRSAVVRAGLLDRVASTRRAFIQKPWASIASFALAGALVGGVVSGAAALSSREDDPGHPVGPTASQGPGVPAPPGVFPGAPIISLLGSSSAFTVDETTTLDLGLPPEGSTHVRVAVTCLDPGGLSWGFDSGGNNPSLGCSQADVSAAGRVTTWFDFPLEGPPILYLESWGGLSAIVTTQFLNYVETAWGVNARGETYGVAKDGQGDPDLMAVAGTASDGSPIEGYARVLEMQGGPQPSNPAEAAEWDPEPHEVAIYESDGETVIGTFWVG